MALQGVEALLFDVFGTVVDWQGSVAEELRVKNETITDGIRYTICHPLCFTDCNTI